jgi:2'-5' RNA ligase
MNITEQALDLASTVTVTPEAMEPPGRPVPDDPAAVSLFTAHRVDEILHKLSHATQRMEAARTASGDLRKYHAERVAGHLKSALDAGHDLAANIRAHYPAEAAELEQVRQTVGLARGYELNARSGMISLDLPAGTIAPVPGGVPDHHVTVVYLGPDVDDEAFAQACARAQDAAAAMPGPLPGTVGGIGSFKPSDGSDGKVPAWAGVVLPGAERLRSALEDLSASEHKDWKPHVTLAYVEPGEALPDPVPATPVTFTHLSVHRGDDEVKRFPLGGKAAALANAGTVTAQVLGLAKAVSDDARAATTAHLTETTLHELTHASRHAECLLEGPGTTEWTFNADHAQKHLGGATEHAGKLAGHFRDNYPAEAKWLNSLGGVTAGAGEDGGGKKKQHARYAGSGGTVSAQMANGGTISGQAG